MTKTIAIAPAHKNQMPNYISWLSKRGFKYHVLGPGDDASDFDMLLLTGGADVGQNIKRDNEEISWYRQARNNDIPVLGICRGLQIVNVIEGGTLIEDIKDKPEIRHTTDPEAIAKDGIRLDSSYHGVKYGNETFEVNSRHHQGISRIAKPLKSVATSIPDGLIEAAVHENGKTLLVQWHPERAEVHNTKAESVVLDWIKEQLK